MLIYGILPGEAAAIRWVLVISPEGKFRSEAFFSTDTEFSAIKIVEYHVLCWNVDVTFEESRRHLGIETQRQSSDKAIERTTPALFGLYSIECLIALRLSKSKDELGFDQYQVRGDRAIRRHWYMVFLMYSYIIFHRQCGSFRKWCTHTCHTFGQLLDVIRTKLMLHFQKWCMDNPESWHDFLQNEKGIPKTAIAA